MDGLHKRQGIFELSEHHKRLKKGSDLWRKLYGACFRKR